MGMAASQARFLQLTARKSNIEYQGQQINQQRLALANASAGLFEKMLTLEVPTPPSSQDDKYYKQGYTFTDKADNIQKKVSWSSDTVTVGDLTDSLGVAAGTSTITLTKTGATAGSNISTVVSANTIAAAAGGDATAMKTVADALGTGLTAEQSALGYKEVIRNVTITHNVYDPDGNYTTINKTAPALLTFDNLNRLTNMVLMSSDDKTIDVSDDASTTQQQKQVGKGEALTYSAVFDQTSYQDDVNEYEFKKAAYDYQIEEINGQTKQVQQQDKSLELKMKQLDTEHNAVQTEMEAVQKVISKNIEGTFKTFA
jgi:hypothetical protein